MVVIKYAALAAALVHLAAASPCPFGQLAEEGQLDDAQTVKFYRARDEGEAFVEELISEWKMDKRDEEVEFARQEEFYKRQLEARELDIGGGLIGGALQPFTGELSGLKLPTPQKFGLAVIPDKEHPYVTPKVTDVRGMCPTLNTMANHGYINHDGITSFAQAANACQITLGFGYDTCSFLSALGLIAGGDLVSGLYSIGGEDSRVPNTLGPALGISKHGTFECDDSITRIDTYLGNQANFHRSRFERWYRIAKKNGGYFNMDTMNEERQVSYEQSRNTNPQFNGEAKPLAVQLAERVFIPRALPNGTHEYLADYQNIAPFYMNETFPTPNWFRRRTPYGLEDVGADVVQLYALGPTAIGHNEGYDNFVGTGGGFDLADFTPAQGACFLADNVLDFTPGEVSPVILANFDLIVAFFKGAIKPFFGKFHCDDKSYSKPGKNAGNATPGVSTKCNVLVNGRYQCKKK